MLPIKQQLSEFNHYDKGNTKEYIVIHDTGNNTDSDEGNANYFCTGDRDASAHYFVDDDSITQVVEDNDCSWHCGDGNGKYGITNRNSIGIEQCRTDYVVSEITESNTIELVKYLMNKYNIPLEKVVRHYDASRKNCPSSFNLDKKWTRWFDFKNRLTAPSTPLVLTGELYRVRKSWQDINSQLNAYTVLDNAKACVDKNAGYKVFNSKGEVVYPVVSAPIVNVDANVLALQKTMNRLKVTSKPIAEDGIMGNETKGAVIAFQGITHAEQDGIVGQNTQFRINEILSKPFVDVIHKNNTFAVMYIQWRVGTINDGVYGNKTYEAIKAWQKKNGLVADGQVGNMTWSKLIG